MPRFNIKITSTATFKNMEFESEADAIEYFRSTHGNTSKIEVEEIKPKKYLIGSVFTTGFAKYLLIGTQFTPNFDAKNKCKDVGFVVYGGSSSGLMVKPIKPPEYNEGITLEEVKLCLGDCAELFSEQS